MSVHRAGRKWTQVKGLTAVFISFGKYHKSPSEGLEVACLLALKLEMNTIMNMTLVQLDHINNI